MFKAAIFRDGSDDAHLEDVEADALRPDEVLVRIVGTGICHTDLTCLNGFMRLPRPVILGHEGAGVVDAVGSDVRKVEPGDHVVLSYPFCGRCPACVAGRPYHCHHSGALNRGLAREDGSSAISRGEETIGSHFFCQSSFADYAVAREMNVVRVRKDAPLEMLGPFGCGVQTGAGAVFNVLRPRPGEPLCVLGAGGVGLSAVMAAKVLKCAPIIVVEPNPERRALALDLGADHAVAPQDDLAAQLNALSDGGVLYMLDTVGRPQAFEPALAALRPGGHLGLVAANAADARASALYMSLIGKGLTVTGIRMGESLADEFIPFLVDLYMAGEFPIDRMVRFYPFAEIDQALHDQETGVTVKPVLRMAEPDR